MSRVSAGPRRGKVEMSLDGLDAILDETDPEKLVEFIRKKKGLRNVHRIFNTEVRIKRSFPFEFERINPPTPTTPVHARVDDKVSDGDENSSANVNALDPARNQSIKCRDKNEDDIKNSLRSNVYSRRRLSNHLHRKALLKTINRIQNDEVFKPCIASTPLQSEAPFADYGSIISCINLCSDQDSPPIHPLQNQRVNINVQPNNENLNKETNASAIPSDKSNGEEQIVDESASDDEELEVDEHQEQHLHSNSRRTTQTQPKTITESLMCRSIVQAENLIENHIERTNNGTQLYPEGMDVDETLVERRSAIDYPSNHANIDENNASEETFMNQSNDKECQQDGHQPKPQNLPKSSRIPRRIYQNTPGQKNRHNNHREIISHGERKPPDTSNQSIRRHDATVVQSASKKSITEVLSVIADKLELRNNTILAPATPNPATQPLRTPNQSSIIIPATQSPRMHVSCPKSPVVVMPVYPPNSCHQNHCQTFTTSPAVHSNPKPAARNSHIAANSSNMIHNEESRSNTNPNNTITKNRQPLNYHQERSSGKRVSFNGRCSLGRQKRLESELLTSDEENVENHCSQQNDDVLHDKTSRRSSGLAAIDLRIASRRSNNHNPIRESMQSTSSLNSDSGDISIGRIDRMLKKLDKSGKSQSSFHVANSAKQSEQMQPVSSSDDENPFEDLDESMLKSMEGETERNEYVYDLPPQLGKLYMESIRKNSENPRSMAAPTRRRRAKSQKQTGKAQAVTYDDIECTMQEFLKSKRRTKAGTSNNCRQRKLYSNDLSNTINSFADESHCTISHVMHEKTLQSKKSILDKKTNILKCRQTPKPIKRATIKQLVEAWLESNKKQHPKRRFKRTKGKVVNDEDEMVFRLSSKFSKKPKGTIENRVPILKMGSNIKMTLAGCRTVTTDDRNSDSSETDHSNSKCGDVNEVRLEQASNSPAPQSTQKQSNPVKSHDNLNSNSYATYNTTRKNASKCPDSTVRGNLSALEKVSFTVVDNCDEVRAQQEHPVEPDHVNTSEHHRNLINKSGKVTRRTSMVNTELADQSQQKEVHDKPANITRKSSNQIRNQSHRNFTIDVDIDPRPSKETENHTAALNKQKSKSVVKSKRSVKKKSTEQASNATEIADIDLRSTVDIEVESQLGVVANAIRENNNNENQNESRRQSKIDAHVESAPLQDIQNRVSMNEKQKAKKKPDRKKKTSKQVANECEENDLCFTAANINENESCLPLRRSNRKHRLPRPYWTSRYDYNEPEKISYIDYIPKKQQKRKLKSINKISNLPSSPPPPPSLPPPPPSSPPSSPPPPSSSIQQTDEQNRKIADNLFEAVKELSQLPEDTLLRELPPPILPSPPPPPPPRKRDRKPKNDRNTCTQSIANRLVSCTDGDSGNATDSTIERNVTSTNLLLSWLKSFLEPQTISENPDLVKIFQSNISIEPSNNLKFQSLDGVEYAFYTHSADIRNGNYGYMRFQAHSKKRSAKTRSHELRFLCIFGNLTLKTGDHLTDFKGGDFLTVPMGTRYSLENNTDNVTLIFFIRNEQ